MPTRSMRLPCLLAAALLLPATVLGEGVVPRAWLVVVGPADTTLYGQAGYCGDMQPYDREARSGVPLTAGQKTWVRLRDPRCGGDLSFTPEPARTYLLRVIRPRCEIDLYRVNPGRDPTREPITIEPRRSCLLPWNHGQAPAPAPAAASSPP